METATVVTKILPMALGVIMFGLGLSLTVADFKRVAQYPKAVVVGLFCQTVLLPVACFLIARGFRLSPELAVGLMLLAASPGGVTANLYSHLSRGDVALNITLTAINSAMSLLTLPLIVGFSMYAFFGEGKVIEMQTEKVVQVFAVVLVPVTLGMWVRARQTKVARMLERSVRLLSVGVLFLAIAFAIVKERPNLGAYFSEVGLPSLVFNLTSLAIGYLVPIWLRLERKQAIAIGMEIGIHNATLAIAVATTVLGSTAMAVPPAIYSLIMFITAAVFGFIVQGKAETPVGQPNADVA